MSLWTDLHDIPGKGEIMKLRNCLIVLFAVFVLAGCSSQLASLQSDIFAWDDANAQRNRDFMVKFGKAWPMNDAAIRKLIGAKLNDGDHYKLKTSMDELLTLSKKATLTDEEVGAGIVTVGQFLDAGGQELAQTIIPKLIGLFKTIQGL